MSTDEREKTMTITEFLLARIAEDEAVARAAIGPRVNISSPDGRWRFIDAGYDGTWPRSVELGYDDPEDIVWSKEAWAVHASRHDPARVLRECAAKREIIEAADHGYLSYVAPLAAIYSDHPDYQEEWAL